MNLFVTLYAAILFFILTPGILVTLPPKGKKIIVALVHTVIFSIVWHFSHRFIWLTSLSFDGFKENDGFSGNIQLSTYEGLVGNVTLPDNIDSGNIIIPPPSGNVITSKCKVHQMVGSDGICVDFIPTGDKNSNKYTFYDFSTSSTN